jgi:hypothetical protein
MKYLSIALLLLVSISSYADSDRDRITKPILEAIHNGEIHNIFSMGYPKGSAERKYFSDSDVKEYDAQFSSLLESLGKSNGYFEHTKSDIPDTFEIVHYLFKFERQPALVVFQLYKPKNKWGLHSLFIDTSIGDYMDTSAKNKIGLLGDEDFRQKLKANKDKHKDK